MTGKVYLMIINVEPFEEEFSQQLNKQRIKIQLDVYYGPLD